MALMRVTNVTWKSFKMCANTVFTWLAVVNAEDDEGPPFSHRNADEVEAPPCKRSVSHPKAEAANLVISTAPKKTKKNKPSCSWTLNTKPGKPT